MDLAEAIAVDFGESYRGFARSALGRIIAL
jgi:hypothetical protein